jgi:hypothetical protein
MKGKTRRARRPGGSPQEISLQLAERSAQPPVCAVDGGTIVPEAAVDMGAETFGASTDICFVDQAHPPSAKAGDIAETAISAPATKNNPLRTGSPPFDEAGRSNCA